MYVEMRVITLRLSWRRNIRHLLKTRIILLVQEIADQVRNDTQEDKNRTLITNIKSMQKTSPEISELKQKIEESVGRKMKTSNDFTFLSGAIWERTHENLSTSTLKRLWGYVDGPDTARNSTLEILSKFLGFKDWDGFLEHISQDNGSDRVTKQHIKTDDLKVGDHVNVSWKPNRRCTFRYLGDYRFVVEQAENSKLKVGNTFRCALFILGEPLYLNDLVQGDNPPVAFVVGNKDGLCELEIKSS